MHGATSTHLYSLVQARDHVRGVSCPRTQLSDLAYINHSLKEHEDVYHWSSSLRISHNLFFTHCT